MQAEGCVHKRVIDGFAVVLDLCSRQVIFWSMKPRICSDLAIDAMLVAVWRRKPQQQVMVLGIPTGDWWKWTTEDGYLQIRFIGDVSRS